jgi:hypothetical protein
MAVITSYSTLLTEIAAELARSDLTAAIPGFVQSWEEDFLMDPENHGQWMETALSVTLSNNVAAVPTTVQYLRLKVAYFSGRPPLWRKSLADLYERWPRGGGSAGVAKCIARNGANFEFGPETQSGTLLGTYYGKPTLLRSFASDAAAHYLIVNAPQLCLYGAIQHAMPYLQNDERISTWNAAYNAQVESYRRKNSEEDSSGSTPFTVVC